MDRFIEEVAAMTVQGLLNLKSNMDRFIELKKSKHIVFLVFKIQYG